MKRRAAFAALLFCCGAGAAETSPAVKAEIEALLGKLEASGCQFDRNGSWYNGSEARDHLKKKLAYIERKGAVRSTEQFIDLAASRSSVSGRPYQVKCTGEPTVESQVWLSKELAALRKTTPSR